MDPPGALAYLHFDPLSNWNCRFCRISVDSAVSLQAHRQTDAHLAKTQYRSHYCLSCEPAKWLHNRRLWSTHRGDQHNILSPNTGPGPLSEQDEFRATNEPFLCPYCPVERHRFRLFSGLRQHMLALHPDRDIDLILSHYIDGTSTCRICPNGYMMTKAQCTRHLEVHQVEFERNRLSIQSLQQHGTSQDVQADSQSAQQEQSIGHLDETSQNENTQQGSQDVLKNDTTSSIIYMSEPLLQGSRQISESCSPSNPSEPKTPMPASSQFYSNGSLISTPQVAGPIMKPFQQENFDGHFPSGTAEHHMPALEDHNAMSNLGSISQPSTIGNYNAASDFGFSGHFPAPEDHNAMSNLGSISQPSTMGNYNAVADFGVWGHSPALQEDNAVSGFGSLGYRHAQENYNNISDSSSSSQLLVPRDYNTVSTFGSLEQRQPIQTPHQNTDQWGFSPADYSAILRCSSLDQSETIQQPSQNQNAIESFHFGSSNQREPIAETRQDQNATAAFDFGSSGQRAPMQNLVQNQNTTNINVEGFSTTVFDSSSSSHQEPIQQPRQDQNTTNINVEGNTSEDWNEFLDFSSLDQREPIPQPHQIQNANEFDLASLNQRQPIQSPQQSLNTTNVDMEGFTTDDMNMIREIFDW
ncbi:uncharacterized protein LY89DRAFT_346890 [Mollisia scopiformis]|uniref:C2H2-type domain-containing protein n=1 Tax=Mollisia scopiformis TaxID=149040 RepID=A0A132B8J2_MOLSC|nr:uncharacterized protein LY89DRAFT_346890 [Mollisia scopiformis]KUJ07987.1 hypothetical protein LY89DRAFT_346890 [Mollisia scopiformis]